MAQCWNCGDQLEFSPDALAWVHSRWFGGVRCFWRLLRDKGAKT